MGRKSNKLAIERHACYADNNYIGSSHDTHQHDVNHDVRLTVDDRRQRVACRILEMVVEYRTDHCYSIGERMDTDVVEDYVFWITTTTSG
jgi:hypothetical protein